ncbi:MAG: lipoyl(octanoyl) transferase LipB [Flavobacteriales bacterium]|nr:lipoyl(octanoyl) transferase LipB [Flavobacteriales bacterium]
MQNRRVFFRDYGQIAYKKAWDIQMELFQQIVQQKLNNRELPAEKQTPTPNYLLFCEHNHVYTLGKTGMLENLLLNNQALKEKGIEFFHINRGGDITYHGPGQLTGYPIFDLDNFESDIIKFMRNMEEAIIRMLAEFGLKGDRIQGLTGVWLDANNPLKARKICAMGVHTSRWVTMHGFGLNISTNLDYFGYIIPCGIQDKSVTSMEKEIGPVDVNDVKKLVREKFAEVFGFSWAEEE